MLTPRPELQFLRRGDEYTETVATHKHQMSRAARTARGAIFAFVSTVLAAASHALAGGFVTPEAMAVTAIIALPVSVALSGRIASLWRVSLVVGLSQFFYHWTFSGLGIASAASSAATEPLGVHAAHLAALERFVPTAIEAGAADSTMWLLHAVAAILSIALITCGERAVLALLRTIRRAVPRALVRVSFALPARVPAIHVAPRLVAQRFSRSARSLRGPPLLV